jgi:hypothetical protein
MNDLDMRDKKRVNNLIGEEFFSVNHMKNSITISIPSKTGFILH